VDNLVTSLLWDDEACRIPPKVHPGFRAPGRALVPALTGAQVPAGASRKTHRKPMWVVAVSTASPCRAAGR
jgi:hypothetical protein